MTRRNIWCLALCLLPLAEAFYLPGSAPRDYQEGDPIQLFVNTLKPKGGESTSKLRSLINYDYYHEQFHFCQPEGGPKREGESLGSILFGDRIFNSPFTNIRMLQNHSTCQELCKPTISPEDATFINERIREDYVINWLVDGLPAAEEKKDTRTDERFYDIGFGLGNIYEDEDEEEELHPPSLNTHYQIVLQYHTNDEKNYRVVGVLVRPMSSSAQTGNCEDLSLPLTLSEKHDTTVRFTYTVEWWRSDVRWATRWDNYLHIFDPKIHWFSLVNSLLIVTFLCVMVAMILYRNVARDISRYNAMDLSEDVQEDYGWKLVHGEVFRQPRFPMVLSVFAGNGAQIMMMVGVTLVFALLGFLSPSNRGSLATVMLVCWTLFGSVSGYVSSRVYASLDGQNKAKNIFFTATLLPAFVFSMCFLLNFFLILVGSAGAVPFGTMLVIVLLWFGINAPLSFIGARYGQKHGAVIHPVRVNRIPRQIPSPPRYLRPWVSAFLAGILPFGAAFVELYFIMSSLFASRAYYAFGFLALTSLIVVITTGTVSILFTYFLLCAEEYRWHWRSFMIGGGSAIWVLLYGLFYMFSRLSLHSLTSAMLYVGYLLLLALLDFLVTGTIGFLASYWAVRKLYSAIRID